jgi:methionyl-tRNA formyltransferase
VTDLTDNFETVHDRSAIVGGRLLIKAISDIGDGTATRTPQDSSLATYAKKVEKEDAKIDFSLPASELDFRIRGVTPIPGAFAFLNGKIIKISNATVTAGKGKPGEVIDVSDSGTGYITVACGEGALRIATVVPEGKGRMSAGDFVRGRKVTIGDIFS